MSTKMSFDAPPPYMDNPSSDIDNKPDINTTPSSYPAEKPTHPINTPSGTSPSIPHAVKIRYAKAKSKLLCFGSRNLLIYPSDKSTAETAFELVMPRGAYGRLELHPAFPASAASTSSTSTSLGDMLATSEPSRSGRRYEIFMPLAGLKQEMRCDKGKRHVFSFPVGPDREMERFEWRQSHGKEVRALEGSKWGWKLVRLNENIGNGGGVKKEERDEGVTSDGKEVVAVWADDSCWSMHNVGELQFRGSGASGELGEDWATFVLMSSLCIYQKKIRDQATMSTASSASASSAAVVAAT